MFKLVLLWAVAALAEGMFYANVPPIGTKLKLELLRIALLASLATSLALAIYDWKLWLVPTILGGYRLVNGLRYLRQRLQTGQLRTVSIRAHGWLWAVQLISLGFAWLWLHYSFGPYLLAMLASTQLLASLLLLRASLQTWRHTQPYTATTPIPSNNLPSVSVLIPARNETDALEQSLARLVGSDYPKLEIIVLDDNSVNRRTPEIIRSFAHSGVRFVQGAKADEVNWLAKNQAYARLRSEASGELLLFCGVDALLESQSIRCLVETLLYKNKDMISVLPLKDLRVRTSFSLLQPMRYYWELCLPRRFFKRPPVLSTTWLIRANALDRSGGFKAVSRSVTPEAYFARQAVVTDAYGFIRSNKELGIYSAKPANEQYDTSVRVRYPQLHRRLELVALTSILELALMVGPLVALCLVGFTERTMAYALLWITTTLCLLATYYLAAAATRLNNPLIAWLFMPAAFMLDILILHISMYKYEFATVEWKGRNITPPVMHVIPDEPLAIRPREDLE
jgi:hypothetical protein